MMYRNLLAMDIEELLRAHPLVGILHIATESVIGGPLALGYVLLRIAPPARATKCLEGADSRDCGRSEEIHLVAAL